MADENSTASLKSSLCKQSTKLADGDPIIYQPKLVVTRNDEKAKLNKYEVGVRKDGMSEKVIMLVGATGSGKTTLINGMINYVFGVCWKDSFRFKLITEPNNADQAKSQTKNISSYTIHHQKGFQVPYSLTIVDTPGFGDVDGIDRDMEIVAQMRSFFNSGGFQGIDKLDAVGFVAVTSQPRLTHTQKYIFEQILSMFGKDVESNIFLLLTFSDPQPPQVLHSIQAAKISYNDYFKFNNSALYVGKNLKRKTSDSDDDDDDDDDDFDSNFWKMGEKSFKKFFKCLNRTESKSLSLTKQVLNERHKLENTVCNLQVEISLAINKLDQLSIEVDLVTKHQVDIDSNKDFKYKVKEEKTVMEPIPPGQYITNCMHCHRTCHENCAYKDDDDKYYCCAMNNGNCTQCPEKCHWKMHKNLPHKYVRKQFEVEKTYDKLKKRYEDAQEKKLSAENIVQALKDDYDALQMKVLGMTETVRVSLKRLQEIALKPNPLSTSAYIDILIKAEQAEAEPGWKIRVDHLRIVKQKAEYMQQVADKGFDPLAEAKRKIKEDKEKKKKTIWSQVGDYVNSIFK